jgi:hypothetical protein
MGGIASRVGIARRDAERTAVTVHVQFIAEPVPLTGGDLGSFDLDAVPSIGDTVSLQGVDYVVDSRRWTRLGDRPSVEITVWRSTREPTSIAQQY